MTSSSRFNPSILARSFAALGVASLLGLGVSDAQAQSEPVDMRIGLIYTPSVPIGRCGATPLAENERLQELGFNINIVHSAQLGSENDMAQQISSGELEMGLAASSILAAWVENLSVLEAYYLFENTDQAFRAYQTDTAKELFAELLEVANIRQIGLPWLYGERHVFGNRALREPADFAGLRLRVPETSLSIADAQSLGASPTPVAYAELYLALQQGIADAAEAPASVVRAESFYEPATHFNKTSHLITAAPVIVSEAFWQRLSPEQQEALDQAVADSAQGVRECVEQADEEAYEYWRETGAIEIVDDVNVEALRAQSREFFSEGFPWSDIYVNLIEDLAN
jgi:TRAP-type transport system periplasmic protein